MSETAVNATDGPLVGIARGQRFAAMGLSSRDGRYPLSGSDKKRDIGVRILV